MKALRYMVWLCMLAIIALLFLLRAPTFGGYQIYCVISGSMEPEIGVGDAVFVKTCEPEELQEGDVVTYSLNEGKTLVTHRILKIDKEKGYVQTKGDANETADPNWIDAETILGIVAWHMPKLGIVYRILSEKTGKLYAIAVLLWLFVLQLVLEKGTEDSTRREMRWDKKKGC